MDKSREMPGRREIFNQSRLMSLHCAVWSNKPLPGRQRRLSSSLLTPFFFFFGCFLRFESSSRVFSVFSHLPHIFHLRLWVIFTPLCVGEAEMREAVKEEQMWCDGLIFKCEAHENSVFVSPARKPRPASSSLSSSLRHLSAQI